MEKKKKRLLLLLLPAVSMMVCNAVNTGCGVVGFFKNAACTQEEGFYFLQASSCSMMVRRGGSQKWSCKMNAAYE
jgi:hypothetical protein